MSNLREELELTKQRRRRGISNLIKEAVINVLAEQEIAQATQQTAPPPTEPVQPNSPTQEEPPPVVTPDKTIPTQYTVDDMIRELNAIRSGRSFTDPEIYGKLVTFFKGLDEEDRAVLDKLLTGIAELVTGIEDALENQQTQSQTPSGQAQTQPPVETPQKSAPMPGAQQAAGAAGVGVV